MKRVHQYHKVLEKDLTESKQLEQDAKAVTKDQLDDLTEKLSEFILKFEDSIFKYDEACVTFAGSYSTLSKDLENMLDLHLDQSITFTRRLSKMKSLYAKFDKQRAAPIGTDTQSTPSLSTNQLAAQIEKLLQVHGDTQKQTQQLLHHYSSQSNARETRGDRSDSSHVRLPKISLPKFNGNIMKYQEFMDLFTSTIHKSKGLSPVEKFSYLKDCLTDEALEAISGYHTTDANYQVVLELLKERFGDRQKALNAHYVALMNLPAATNKTSSLRSLVDQLEEHFRSLEACGEDVEQHMFIVMIQNKLPQHTTLQLEIAKTAAGEQWSTGSLRKALKEYTKAKEAAEPQSAPTAEKENPQQLKKSTPYTPYSSTSALLHTDRSRGPKCFFCRASHYSDECTKFRSAELRKAQIQDRCFRCLKSSHRAAQCTINRLCYHCSQPHHRSLCPTKFGSSTSASSSGSALTADAEPFTPCSTTTEPTLISTGEQVYMQTALVHTVSGTTDVKARLLFDTGASRSYITEELRQRLHLLTVRKDTIANASFGSAKRKQQTLDAVNLSIRLSDGTLKPIAANVVPIISSSIQRMPLDRSLHPSLQKLELAEPLIDKPERVTIDILIGGDYYHEFILGDRITFADGLLLLDSQVGFVCAGKSSPASNRYEHQSLLFSSEPIDPQLDLERFWSIEDLCSSRNPSDDDFIAESQFEEDVQFRDGRYVVQWPWKTGEFDLRDDFGLAHGRLRSLLHRLHGQPEVLTKYNDILLEQKNMGIIEEVQDEDEDTLKHYLPHHCVVKPDKTTTKLRLVYDASAKSSKNACSLNDCLYRGPVLLPELGGMLLRFRVFPIAVCSDVEKAFLQIGLHEKDRDVTRFLWVKDITKPLSKHNLVVYRFCRVPFGVVSSPFLLAATLRHHLTESKVPSASDVLANTYVDNVLHGVNSIPEAKNYYTSMKSVFTEASMNLREWCSNSEELMSSIPVHDRAKADTQKILGMDWDTLEDTLNVTDTNASARLVRSKRELLQAIAMFFDPLGLHSPLVTRAKLLLQQVWRLNCGWDDPLPQNVMSEWLRLAPEFDDASKKRIPRYCSNSGASRHTLHVFCDASLSAYGVAAYLESVGETTSSNLIFSKSRLAPIKPSPKLTIPRMELLAAALGAEVASYLQAQLSLTLHETCLWIDSTCVLGWIKSKKSLPAFIARRVAIIHSCGAEYRYVPSKDNPADLPSRGTSHLADEKLWWHGPTWLRDHSIPRPDMVDLTESESLRSKKKGEFDSSPPHKKKEKKKEGDGHDSLFPDDILCESTQLAGEGPTESESIRSKRKGNDGRPITLVVMKMYFG